MVNNTTPIFPLPDESAKAHSECLLSHVLANIRKNNRIKFSEYMEQVLYTPQLGYYTGGSFKIGSAGDFITAPELSPLFSRCLAQNFLSLNATLGPNLSMLEFGAGSGKMAADILLELEQKQALPEKYYILELSPQLKSRQLNTFKKMCPHLLERIIWLDHLENFQMRGLIVANEILDAMPVRLFSYQKHELFELYVIEKNGQLDFEKVAKNKNCTTEQYIRDCILQYIQHADASEVFFEVNKNIRPWVKTLSDILTLGAVLILDYGFPRQELYHPDRYMGSLMCHYRHRAHTDPFLYPGLQDITAHVDFTLVAESACDYGFDILGFTNQTSFLINSGLTNLLQYTDLNEKDKIQQNHAVQVLTSPSEMGELVKVIGLGKNLESLNCFSFNNQLHRL